LRKRRGGTGKREKRRFSYLGRRKASKGGAYSMHEGGVFVKSRLRQALGQGIGDIKGTPMFVKLDFASTYSLAEKMTF